MAAGVQRRRAERTIDACRDRPPPSDLPSIWRPCRKPWPGAVRPRVARLPRGLVNHRAILEWLACLARTCAWSGARRVVCLRSRPAMERLSTAPGVCPFRARSPAPCGHVGQVGGDRRQTRDYTVAQAPSGTPPVPGVYRDAGNRPFAVNVDTRESALDRIDAAAFDAMVPRSQQKASQAAEIQAQQTESRQSYWQYGLALLIATLVAESVVGRA